MNLDAAGQHESSTVATAESATPVMVLSDYVAERLLDRLSTDDGFRALFESNPRAALREVGHETPEAFRDVKGADPVLCLYSRQPLASKEAIRAARDELKTRLTRQIFSWSINGL